MPFNGPQKRGAKRERKMNKRIEAEERQLRRRPLLKDVAPEIPLYPMEDTLAEEE